MAYPIDNKESDDVREREHALAGILAGLRDVEEGRIQPLERAFDDLRKEFNLPPREKRP